MYDRRLSEKAAIWPLAQIVYENGNRHLSEWFDGTLTECVARLSEMPLNERRRFFIEMQQDQEQIAPDDLEDLIVAVAARE